MNIKLRLASMADAGEIGELIEESVRKLQAADYSEEQREAALGAVFGVDRQLIRDGTYYVAMVGEVIAGCGGWSYRKTLYGSDHVAGKDDALLDPATDAARIRAFFIRPGWERRGIGSMILETCEDAAAAAGFRNFELGSTLTGVALYAARGFAPVENVDVPLGNGVVLPIVRMRKERRG